MTFAIFHDFPGLENGLPKFHDFPWPGGTLSLAPMKPANAGSSGKTAVKTETDIIINFYYTKSCLRSWWRSGCRQETGSMTGIRCVRTVRDWLWRCPRASWDCRWNRCCPDRRTPRSCPTARTRTSSPSSTAAEWRAAAKRPKTKYRPVATINKKLSWCWQTRVTRLAVA